MSVRLPNGSIISIAASYGVVKNMTAISNAAQAVATLEVGHSVAAGDVLEVTSGWSRLDKRVVRVSAIATNDATLEGINTTATTNYPGGSGVGTVREVLTWTQMSQILNSASNGGEQQFLEYQFLESDAQLRIPTTKTAKGLSFTIADDPALAGQILAAQANDDRLVRAVRVALPGGGFIYYNAYISLGEPSLTTNELMAVEVTLSLVSASTRYAT